MILPQDPVQAAIVHALNNHCHEDAIFLSERLFAEVPNDSTLFLLATCYYQAGNKSQAYRFLRSKGYPTSRCRYLFGKCCVDIGKLDEAEFVLTSTSTNRSLKSVNDFSDEYGDNASFAINLLADVCRRTERHEKALEYYEASLSLNPFMWSSFCRMCQLGGKPDPDTVFQASQVDQVMSSVKSVLFSPQVVNLDVISASKTDCNPNNPETPSTPLDSMGSLVDTPPMMSPDTLHTPANEIGAEKLLAAGKQFLSDAKGDSTTPSFGMLPLDTPLLGSNDTSTPAFSPVIKDLPPVLPKKEKLKTQFGVPPLVGKLVFGQSSTSNTKSDVVPPSSRTHHTPMETRRRSKRILDSQNSSNVKENNKVQLRKHISQRSGSRRTKVSQKLSDEVTTRNTYNSVQRPTTAHQSVDVKQRQSANAFLSLLRSLGSAYLASQMFDMKRAVQLFEGISHHQYKTGWVLAELGKVYLELSQHHKAEEAFKELRLLEPYQMQGMDAYSTVLFHLNKEVALSALAQDMVDIDKMSPQTWCVNGNCFSLQKEHATAIKFLQRAIQLDGDFVYAYTLLGHEYTLLEDYDKAMAAFRSALRIDSRHYNAWYGLGMIFYKKEKFTLAERHFAQALKINRQSAVLLCHVGLVQLALQMHSLALDSLNKAVELSPRNPLCLFHRASMLLANDKPKEALEELEALKTLTPKESLVYFLIGKVHKKLGNSHLSMLNFSWATDLDPKGANNHIKDAIDRRYVTDDDEDPSIDSSILLRDTPNSVLSTDTSVMDSDDGQQLQANESDDSL